MATIADQIVETLEIAGVKRIYGVVGDSLNGLTESLRVRQTIDWVHVRHEEAAAFAASITAWISSSEPWAPWGPGVCWFFSVMVSSGPPRSGGPMVSG